MAYPLTSTSGTALTSSPRFPDIEEAVLAHWREHDTFARSVEQRPAGEDVPPGGRLAAEQQPEHQHRQEEHDDGELAEQDGAGARV